mmetsp:Transcript_8181/g.19564  ORF Transcript_8181/g.19564 Transcript_8181/m.19564 type:complete len:360 (+) Transcript_8181:91-1170(+)
MDLIGLTQKDKDKILKKRQDEVERRKRFLDARTRKIGLDMQTLNQQTMERHTMEQTERDADRTFALNSQYIDEMALANQAQHDAEMRNLDKECRDFSMTELAREKRREFALYDPDGLKKDRPARVGDDDPRCGVSSMQKFDGEDLDHDAREEAKKQYMAQTLQQQMEERRRMEEERRLEEAEFGDHTLAMCNLAHAIEQDEEELRKQKAMEQRDYNRRMMEEKRMAKQAAEDARKATEQRDLDTQMNSQLLGLKDKSHYMAFKQHVLDEQYHQVMEKKAAAKAEQDEEAAFAMLLEQQRHLQNAIEEDKQAQALAERLSNVETNRQMGQARSNMNSRLDALYKNDITPEYYKQFQTKSR